MITSCSPGWIKFMEEFYPDMAENVSSCKSPQQMFGALAKTYYAEKIGIDPSKMVVVSIMPCTAKKFECQRPEMNSSGYQDVDYVLTVRELARMIKQAGIDFRNLPEEEYDAPLGISTGAAVIFGATGGVMEAAVRTAYEIYTGKTLPNVDLEVVRGLDGVKEASVDLNGTTLNVAVANGLANAREVLDKMCIRDRIMSHWLNWVPLWVQAALWLWTKIPAWLTLPSSSLSSFNLSLAASVLRAESEPRECLKYCSGLAEERAKRVILLSLIHIFWKGKSPELDWIKK